MDKSIVVSILVILPRLLNLRFVTEVEWNDCMKKLRSLQQLNEWLHAESVLLDLKFWLKSSEENERAFSFVHVLSWEEARFKLFLMKPLNFSTRESNFIDFLRESQKKKTQNQTAQENIFTHQPDDFNRFSRKCSYVSKKLWLNAGQSLSEQCSKL